MSSSTLKMGQFSTGYVFSIQGRGTARESEILHEYAVQMLLRDDGCVIVDLSICEHLDSTFLGCLADLHKRFVKTGDERFSIAGPPDHCKSLFGSTRLETLLARVDSAPTIDQLQTLDVIHRNSQSFGRHVLNCHRRLAEIDNPNQAVFAEIADRLATELDQR